MNARTLSASTLAVLAFATVALSQTQPTTNSTHADPSSRSLTPGYNDFGNSESIDKASFLKPFVGTWKGTATLHGVDGADSSSTISCTSVLTFGHYLTTNFGGQIMGETFEAVQTWGFNTATNTFETTWIDNNSTGITFNNGSSNESGTTLTIDGQVQAEDGSVVIQRSVTTLVDNEHFTLELISVDSQGASTPVMTISFTRQSSTALAKPFAAPTGQDQPQQANATNDMHRNSATAAAQDTTQNAAVTTPVAPVPAVSTASSNAPTEMRWASASDSNDPSPQAQQAPATDGMRWSSASGATAANAPKPHQIIHRFLALSNVKVEVTSAQIDAQRQNTASGNDSHD